MRLALPCQAECCGQLAPPLCNGAPRNSSRPARQPGSLQRRHIRAARLPQKGRKIVAVAADVAEQVAEEPDWQEMQMLAQRLMVEDPDKPSYHVMCNKGWLNDPNGPVYHDGKYHLFYQHLVDSCEWSFGIVWGHAVSEDLVHWKHLEPALLPTPGGADADGCFSGCCIQDLDGTPVILYTGVRLRSNPECGPLPPANRDLNLPFIESQLSARPIPGDSHLRAWEKTEAPLIAMPPADMPLVGWRDPFIFEVGSDGREWGMLMGSGLKGKGGAVMIYRAATLHGEWRFAGMLCGAETTDTGAMWECPLLLELQPLPNHLRPAGLGTRESPSLRSRSESYRSDTEVSDSDSSDDEWRDGAANGAEPPIAQQNNGSTEQANATHLPPAADAFEHPEEADAAALAGHPEEGEAGQAVAEGTAPGMDDEFPLHPAPIELAAAKLDAFAGFAATPEAAQRQRSPTEMPAEPLRPKVAPLPTPLLDGQIQSVKPAAEPPPRFTHFMCVSPDAPTNPVLYWLGRFDAKATEFLLAGAKGPLRLDLGDILYAPNLQTDAQGRHVLWGWLQERRKAGSYDYSGCMTVPRLLYLEDERLIQMPIPEVAHLRTEQVWTVRDMEIPCDLGVAIPGPANPALDMHIILQRGDAASAGLLFRSWNAGGEGSAAILFDFERNILEAVFEGGGTDLLTSPELFDDDDTVRRVGGPTEMAAGRDCHLRVLMDHSCIEVFNGTGEVLSTRIYRGHPPEGADSGISFISFGGTARVAAADTWGMGSIWREDMPSATGVQADAAASAPTHGAAMASTERSEPAAEPAPAQVSVMPITVA